MANPAHPNAPLADIHHADRTYRVREIIEPTATDSFTKLGCAVTNDANGQNLGNRLVYVRPEPNADFVFRPGGSPPIHCRHVPIGQAGRQVVAEEQPDGQLRYRLLLPTNTVPVYMPGGGVYAIRRGGHMNYELRTMDPNQVHARPGAVARFNELVQAAQQAAVPLNQEPPQQAVQQEAQPQVVVAPTPQQLQPPVDVEPALPMVVAPAPQQLQPPVEVGPALPTVVGPGEAAWTCVKDCWYQPMNLRALGCRDEADQYIRVVVFPTEGQDFRLPGTEINCRHDPGANWTRAESFTEAGQQGWRLLLPTDEVLSFLPQDVEFYAKPGPPEAGLNNFIVRAFTPEEQQVKEAQQVNFDHLVDAEKQEHPDPFPQAQAGAGPGSTPQEPLSMTIDVADLFPMSAIEGGVTMRYYLGAINGGSAEYVALNIRVPPQDPVAFTLYLGIGSDCVKSSKAAYSNDEGARVIPGTHFKVNPTPGASVTVRFFNGIDLERWLFQEARLMSPADRLADHGYDSPLFDETRLWSLKRTVSADNQEAVNRARPNLPLTELGVRRRRGDVNSPGREFYKNDALDVGYNEAMGQINTIRCFLAIRTGHEPPATNVVLMNEITPFTPMTMTYIFLLHNEQGQYFTHQLYHNVKLFDFSANSDNLASLRAYLDTDLCEPQSIYGGYHFLRTSKSPAMPIGVNPGCSLVPGPVLSRYRGYYNAFWKNVWRSEEYPQDFNDEERSLYRQWQQRYYADFKGVGGYLALPVPGEAMARPRTCTPTELNFAITKTLPCFEDMNFWSGRLKGQPTGSMAEVEIIYRFCQIYNSDENTGCLVYDLNDAPDALQFNKFHPAVINTKERYDMFRGAEFRGHNETDLPLRPVTSRTTRHIKFAPNDLAIDVPKAKLLHIYFINGHDTPPDFRIAVINVPPHVRCFTVSSEALVEAIDRTQSESEGRDRKVILTRHWKALVERTSEKFEQELKRKGRRWSLNPITGSTVGLFAPITTKKIIVPFMAYQTAPEINGPYRLFWIGDELSLPAISQKTDSSNHAAFFFRTTRDRPEKFEDGINKTYDGLYPFRKVATPLFDAKFGYPAEGFYRYPGEWRGAHEKVHPQQPHQPPTSGSGHGGHPGPHSGHGSPGPDQPGPSSGPSGSSSGHRGSGSSSRRRRSRSSSRRRESGPSSRRRRSRSSSRRRDSARGPSSSATERDKKRKRDGDDDDQRKRRTR